MLWRRYRFFHQFENGSRKQVHKLAVQPEDMVLFDFCLQIGNALVNDRSYLLLLVLSITQYVGIRSGCDFPGLVELGRH